MFEVHIDDPDFTGTKTVAGDGRIYLTEDLAGEEVRVAAELIEAGAPMKRAREAAKQLTIALEQLDDDPDALLMALGFVEEWLTEHGIDQIQERAVEAVEEREVDHEP